MTANLHSSEASYLGDLVAACVQLDEAWDLFVEHDLMDPVVNAIGEMREALHGFQAASVSR